MRGNVVAFPHYEQRHFGSGTVDRINLYDLYDAGVKIHPLERLSHDTSLNNAYFLLTSAESALTALTSGRIVTLMVCRHAALELRDAVNGVLHDRFFDAKGELDLSKNWSEEKLGFGAFTISAALPPFEHVFAAELRELSTYSVPRRGGFDTRSLTENWKVQIPAALHPAIGKALDDYEAAGKCYAFGLWTASGFHALRSVEVILQDYYSALGGTNAKQSWGWNDYLTALEELQKREGGTKPDPKTLRSIRQIKDLDRNPLMHPRESYDETAALVVLNIATNAIIGMATEMVALESTPDIPGLLEGDTTAAKVITYGPGKTEPVGEGRSSEADASDAA